MIVASSVTLCGVHIDPDFPIGLRLTFGDRVVFKVKFCCGDILPYCVSDLLFYRVLQQELSLFRSLDLVSVFIDIWTTVDLYLDSRLPATGVCTIVPEIRTLDSVHVSGHAVLVTISCDTDTLISPLTENGCQFSRHFP